MKYTFRLVFFLCCLVRAEAGIFGGYAFSLGGETGLLLGMGDEMLYRASGTGYLSRLTWDVKPLFFYGISAVFGPEDTRRQAGFFADFSLKSGVSFGRNGRMRDRDWTGGDLPTDFSEHEVMIDRALILDFSAGFVFPVPFGAVRLFAGFSYINFFWTAHNGYYRYTTGGVRNGDFTGPVANYDQYWLVPYPGAAAEFSLGPRLGAELSFAISPLFRFGAVDHHLLKIDSTGSNPYSEYSDYAMGFLYLKPGAELVFSPRRGLRFSLAYAFSYMKSAKGSMYMRVTGMNGNNKDVTVASNHVAGALSFHEFSIKVSVDF
jgi:outer membrane protease